MGGLLCFRIMGEGNNDELIKIFRQSDILRWRSLDFVIGYEIKTSNNPQCDCEICNRLSGKYPKSFNWNGWHKGCHCYIVPILIDDETFRERRVSRFRDALHGTNTASNIKIKQIEYVPLDFINCNIEHGFLKSRHDEVGPYYIVENMELIIKSYEHYKYM